MEHRLTHEEIQAILEGRALLVDVRSDAEVAEHTCRAAMHWDVQEMVEGRFPSVDKSMPVFVFCRSGNRSATAQTLLLGNGFTDVHNIGGVHSVPDELC